MKIFFKCSAALFPFLLFPTILLLARLKLVRQSLLIIQSDSPNVGSSALWRNFFSTFAGSVYIILPLWNVVLFSGQVYERRLIEKYIQENGRDPISKVITRESFFYADMFLL